MNKKFTFNSSSSKRSSGSAGLRYMNFHSANPLRRGVVDRMSNRLPQGSGGVDRMSNRLPQGSGLGNVNTLAHNIVIPPPASCGITEDVLNTRIAGLVQAVNAVDYNVEVGEARVLKQIHEVDRKLIVSNSRMDEMNYNVGEISGRVSAAHIAVDAARDRIETVSDRVSAAHIAVDAARDRIETVSDRVSAAHDAVDAGRQHLETVSDRVSAAHDAVDAGRQHLETVSDQIHDVNHTLDGHVANINAKVDIVSTQIQGIHHTLDGHHVEMVGNVASINDKLSAQTTGVIIDNVVPDPDPPVLDGVVINASSPSSVFNVNSWSMPAQAGDAAFASIGGIAPILIKETPNSDTSGGGYYVIEIQPKVTERTRVALKQYLQFSVVMNHYDAANNLKQKIATDVDPSGALNNHDWPEYILEWPDHNTDYSPAPDGRYEPQAPTTAGPDPAPKMRGTTNGEIVHSAISDKYIFLQLNLYCDGDGWLGGGLEPEGTVSPYASLMGIENGLDDSTIMIRMPRMERQTLKGTALDIQHTAPQILFAPSFETAATSVADATFYNPAYYRFGSDIFNVDANENLYAVASGVINGCCNVNPTGSCADACNSKKYGSYAPKAENATMITPRLGKYLFGGTADAKTMLAKYANLPTAPWFRSEQQTQLCSGVAGGGGSTSATCSWMYYSANPHTITNLVLVDASRVFLDAAFSNANGNSWNQGTGGPVPPYPCAANRPWIGQTSTTIILTNQLGASPPATPTGIMNNQYGAGTGLEWGGKNGVVAPNANTSGQSWQTSNVGMRQGKAQMLNTGAVVYINGGCNYGRTPDGSVRDYLQCGNFVVDSDGVTSDKWTTLSPTSIIGALAQPMIFSVDHVADVSAGRQEDRGRARGAPSASLGPLVDLPLKTRRVVDGENALYTKIYRDSLVPIWGKTNTGQPTGGHGAEDLLYIYIQNISQMGANYQQRIKAGFVLASNPTGGNPAEELELAATVSSTTAPTIATSVSLVTDSAADAARYSSVFKVINHPAVEASGSVVAQPKGSTVYSILHTNNFNSNLCISKIETFVDASGLWRMQPLSNSVPGNNPNLLRAYSYSGVINTPLPAMPAPQALLSVPVSWMEVSDDEKWIIFGGYDAATNKMKGAFARVYDIWGLGQNGTVPGLLSTFEYPTSPWRIKRYPNQHTHEYRETPIISSDGAYVIYNTWTDSAEKNQATVVRHQNPAMVPWLCTRADGGKGEGKCTQTASGEHLDKGHCLTACKSHWTLTLKDQKTMTYSCDINASGGENFDTAAACTAAVEKKAACPKRNGGAQGNSMVQTKEGYYLCCHDGTSVTSSFKGCDSRQSSDGLNDSTCWIKSGGGVPESTCDMSACMYP